MKLLVFLAKGFETIEFSGFIDVMGWAKTDFGCDVEVVTGGFNEKVISSFNIPVLVDKTIDEISVDEYDKTFHVGLAYGHGFHESTVYIAVLQFEPGSHKRVEHVACAVGEK